MKIENSELSAVTVDEMVRMLTKAYTSLLQTDTPLRSFPSVMLWGAPGVGKSQGVRKLARAIGSRTGKKVTVTDVRLLLFNPVDLRGIPTANADKTLAVWLKPKIFQMDESANAVNILFLDEISAAPPSVQAAAYQITLDHMIGEHKLPDNCIVIAAGNRVTDRSVAFRMPSALANRLCHFEIRCDVDAWHDWAVRHRLHPFVTGYLEYNPISLLRPDNTGTAVAFPTPRSWEMVSNILQTVSDRMDEVFPMIVGCVGHEAASLLRDWSELYRELPDIEAVFAGNDVPVTQEEEFYIVLRTAMVHYAAAHPSQSAVDRSLDFASRLPWSFRRKLMHDYYYTPALRDLLKNNTMFQAAIKDGQL